MGTPDQMMIDNRYGNHIDKTNDFFSRDRQQNPVKDEDGNGSQGRRVYLESPSFDNKEEEDMYRYVPSRLTDQTGSILDTTMSKPTAGAIMDSLDFELDLLGATNTRSVPSKPFLPATRQVSNIPRSDPRQDPLLGPLLAELDSMSTQQQQQQQQRQFPSSSNLVQPTGSTSTNHALNNFTNRTVNDALLESDLYNTVEPKNPSNVNGTDVFVSSSHNNHSTHSPGSFLSYFGLEDQLFQRPLLNNLGQNYLPQPRNPPFERPRQDPFVPPSQQRDSLQRPRQQLNDQTLPSQQQRDTSYDQRPPYVPSSNPFIQYQQAPPLEQPRSINQDTFFTDHADDQLQNSHRNGEQLDEDSKRQAVWNELQRANVKVQEKNVKKHESPIRNRAPFGSTLTWNNNTGSQQSSAQPKSPPRPFHQPPPISRPPNHIDENIDMIRNKENSYHRYPPRKYENTYAKRKEFEQESPAKVQVQPSSTGQTTFPITLNLNTSENSQNGALSTTVPIPVDSHVNRVGDKISVNIDLRLVDLENLRQQQQQQQQQTVNRPQWSGGDPLDLHIRKLERNIEQTLPTTSPPQRSPMLPSTATNPLFGRYANKQTSGGGRAGYNPPTHGVDYYNYNDRNREEDSYLAKLNQTKRSPQFKPYTGRDYEQFKKNYGFGTGHLGYDFENINHREKLEKMTKTRQYAQQIEARNKKKIAETTRRTLSDTRLPKSTRPSATRTKPFSGKTTNSSPAILDDGLQPFIPARRPTEVLYRPVPVAKPLSTLPHYQTDKPPPIPAYQRRLSPPKQHLPPIGNTKRRPVKFSSPPSASSQQSDRVVMDVIRQELTNRPLDNNEELIIVNHQQL